MALNIDNYYPLSVDTISGDNVEFGMSVSGVVDYTDSVIFSDSQFEAIWALVRGLNDDEYYFSTGDTDNEDGCVYRTVDNFQTLELFNREPDSRNCRGLYVTSSGAVIQGFSEYVTGATPYTARIYRDTTLVYESDFYAMESRNVPVIFEHKNVIYALLNDGTGAKILKSSDDGATWSVFYSNSSVRRYATWLDIGEYFLVSTGYTEGGSAGVLRFDSSGLIEKVVDTSSQTDARLFKVDTKYVVEYGNNTVWLESQDGITWTPWQGTKPSYAPASDGYTWSAYGSYTWLSQRGGEVAYTYDGGQTWDSVTLIGSGNIWSVLALSDNEILVTTRLGGSVRRITPVNPITYSWLLNGATELSTTNPATIEMLSEYHGSYIIGEVTDGVTTDTTPQIAVAVAEPIYTGYGSGIYGLEDAYKNEPVPEALTLRANFLIQQFKDSLINSSNISPIALPEYKFGSTEFITGGGKAIIAHQFKKEVIN
jgi:hypothetical protein